MNINIEKKYLYILGIIFLLSGINVSAQYNPGHLCSAVDGCVASAITDGNTNWGNDYNLLDKDTDSYCSESNCGTGSDYGRSGVSNYLYMNTDTYFYRDSANRIRTPDNFYVDSSSPATYLYSANTYLGASTGDTIRLRGNNFIWNQGVIQGNGNVGIGTTSPEQILHVDGGSEILSTGSGAGFKFRTRSSTLTSDDWVWYSPSAGVAHLWEATNGNLVTVKEDGNVGIGTTNPDYRLKVVGDSATNAIKGVAPGSGVVGEGYTGVGGAGTGCDFNAFGPGTNYCAGSSIRWKKNITEIDNALDKVLNLRGVYFDWDEEHGGRHDIGMIAEEVGEYIPEIVTYEDDGVYTTGMDYGALTPVLVEAIKELKAENDALKQAVCEVNPDADICK